ncbi:hypothetical protein ROZALSC1DRAFT_26584 [Rozella allomycis CSF55]|uniref:DNA-directed RNA polymerase III subunit RPC3 n=1 Tax=Rozella allomycis (strain CSF55) TaxID=988480 RepID=A0A075AT78_ROZAC|nr:hypothetical protein O9G_001232 [Rozella allomycis CSF55]RKP22038.1 hypothetical protein ROZALSC1DRAFT_26584 [Rozella allomycis CSF55]|eukprot:EPZ33481.1 hypothetical protein O9G_001232 [Rozella allomycis CSF55]
MDFSWNTERCLQRVRIPLYLSIVRKIFGNEEYKLLLNVFVNHRVPLAKVEDDKNALERLLKTGILKIFTAKLDLDDDREDLKEELSKKRSLENADDRITKKGVGVVLENVEYVAVEYSCLDDYVFLEELVKSVEERLSDMGLMRSIVNLLYSKGSIGRSISYDQIRVHCKNEKQFKLVDKLEDLLAHLCHENTPFLKMIDRSGGGVYIINVTFGQEYLKKKFALGVINSKFDSLSVRMIRVLLDKGYLEEKQVSKYSMMPNKDVRERLYKLLKHNYVHLQEVPKTPERVINKMFFLWGCDLPKLYQAISKECANGIAKLKQKLLSELKLHDALIQKLERKDVQYNSLLLHSSEQEMWKKLKKTLNHLEISSIELEKMRLIFNLR